VEILLRASKRARTARTIEERESFYSIFSPEIEWIARGDARSSSGWLAAGWAEAGVRLAAPRDQDLLAGRGAFHVIAEVIAELVGADLAPGPLEWSQWDSNPRPFGCHPNALPTELWPQEADGRLRSVVRLAGGFAEGRREGAACICPSRDRRHQVGAVQRTAIDGKHVRCHWDRKSQARSHEAYGAIARPVCKSPASRGPARPTCTGPSESAPPRQTRGRSVRARPPASERRHRRQVLQRRSLLRLRHPCGSCYARTHVRTQCVTRQDFSVGDV
jgi:hypothetical protein